MSCLAVSVGISRSRAQSRLWIGCVILISSLTCNSIAQRPLKPANRAEGTGRCSLPGLLPANETGLTLEELAAVYNQRAALVQSLEASLMVRAQGGKEYRTRARQSKESPAIIAFQAPGWLRLTGVVPFTSKRSFDFSSDGREFRLLVPDRDSMRLLVGAVDAPANSANPRDNLRPQPLIDAFRWTPGTLDSGALSVRPGPNGTSKLVVDYPASAQHTAKRAQLEFDLRRGVVNRLEIQDASLQTITQIDYGDWNEWNKGESQAICFPRRILLTQPKQNLKLDIRIIGFTLNPALTPARFRLPVPPRTPVARVDQPAHADHQ